MGEAGDGAGKLPGTVEAAQVLIPPLHEAGEDTLGMWQLLLTLWCCWVLLSPALRNPGSGLPPMDEQIL